MDNLNLYVKKKPSSDEIDYVDMIFLLEDLSILRNRAGFLTDLTASIPDQVIICGIGLVGCSRMPGIDMGIHHSVEGSFQRKQGDPLRYRNNIRIPVDP